MNIEQNTQVTPQPVPAGYLAREVVWPTTGETFVALFPVELTAE